MLKSRKELLVALVLFSVAVSAAAWNGDAAARALASSPRTTSSISSAATTESGEPDVGGGNKTSSKSADLPAVRRPGSMPVSVWLRWTLRIWTTQYLGARL